MTEQHEVPPEVIKELVGLVNAFNPDIRYIALEQIFGLSGSPIYLPLFRGDVGIVEEICKVIKYDPIAKIRSIAYTTLVNLSGDLLIADEMLAKAGSFRLLEFLIGCVLDRNSVFAEPSSVVLANLSRHEATCSHLLQLTMAQVTAELERVAKMTNIQARPDGHGLCDKKRKGEDESVIYPLLRAFSNLKYNAHGHGLDFLACLFENITQNASGRALVMEKTKFTFQKLLSFANHDRKIRRGGILALIKNCLFDSAYHAYLLSEDVNLLPSLLYPLAGGEEYTDEEMDGMCDELLYLPSDKAREPDMSLRRILLEALLQLCATKFGREYLRDHKAYPILRNLHLAERGGPLETRVCNVVEILISDETGEDLTNLTIPSEFDMGVDMNNNNGDDDDEGEEADGMKVEGLFSSDTVDLSRL